MSKAPGESENERVSTGTYRGYRHGCYGCMPVRNQSHHHRGERRREREKQWHKDGVSLKWSHTRKKQTFIPNVSCAIPKKKKKRAKGKKMSREGKNVYIIKQLQCSCCFISVIIMIIPSSSDTSSISSTVSGKLIRCFSVVVFWAWRKENSYRQQQKGRFNFSYNMFPCDYHHPFSEHLTMETVSSVTSFRTSITEM